MSHPKNFHPPQWPLKLLRFFLKKKYLEEIEGDMEEIFQENLKHHSLRKSNRIYTWEMLKLLRPALVKNLNFFNTLAPPAMFKNYLKISIRGLMKNPVNSTINIVGLSFAIGISMFVYAYANWVYRTDQFHEHKNSVYLVTFFADRDGSPQQYGLTPRPLGEMLQADFTHIKKTCRVEDRSVIIKQQENVFHQRIRFTDPEFFDLFTFPLKWGTPESLKDANSIILSEDQSFKYFGTENPIGQTMLVKFDQNRSKEFKVTGVAQAFPKSRSIEFDFLINFQNLLTAYPGYNTHDWNEFVQATLIQLDHPKNLSFVEQRMERYKKLQNEAVKKEWAISSFTFELLATLYQKSGGIRDDISWNYDSNIQSVIFFVIIGASILALACFNYINIAIVSAAKRLKEIGVRKSIGASRKVVIIQFLTENVVVTLFAMIIGVTLGVTLVIPWFENIFSFSMGFSLLDATLWIYLPAILLFTAIASGSYPAFYISKFQVTGILKGTLKFGNKNPLTKVFLTLQLILACILITCGVMFTQNSDYLAKRSWGYNQHQVLYATVADQAAYEQLHAKLIQHPDVLSISGSADHLGKSKSEVLLHFPDRDYEVDQLSVEANYFETMGIELVTGRGFNHDAKSDRHAVVVNELLTKNLGWTNPVGEVFNMDSIQYEVIGVVKDFHSASFSNPVRPVIFKVSEKQDYRYVSMSVRSGKQKETFQSLLTTWAALFPETPFDGGHQEDSWGTYYGTIDTHGKVWRVIACIAVLLASLGLYGLLTLNVTGRVKEFSIRKVLGAGLWNIVMALTRQYWLLVATALLIGAPLSYFLINLVFDIGYAYHMPLDYSGVSLAVIILSVVLLLTFSTQIRKVVKANPVNGLKVE